MFTHSTESYDLKLDQACIFLEDGSPTRISGTFHMSLPQSSSFKSITVQLLGVLKVPRDDVLIRSERQQTTCISEESIGSSRYMSSFQLPAGDYEFPFSLPVPPRILETITCRRRMSHTYHVQAIIKRRFKGNSTVSRPIRLYHYPDLSADYPSLSIPTVERQSHQGIQYCISLPDSHIPFASNFHVKCLFAPISKTIKLDTVSINILEKHDLRVDATASESVMYDVHVINMSTSCIIFNATYDHPGQTLEAPAPAADDVPSAEWKMSLLVQLPESFSLGSQSVSTRTIHINHTLILQAQFHDTETDTPITIKEKIPFSIYMTPAVINEDGTIHGQDIENFKAFECAPPPYGHHLTDTVPAEWSQYMKLLSVSSQQQCTPIAQESLGSEPPTYQACCT
ncbi:hypothetical protein BJX99DRAFT_262979 [Aspergillus californicus]